MRVLLLTGPGGDAQGWGDLSVTEAMAEAARRRGPPCPHRLRQRPRRSS